MESKLNIPKGYQPVMPYLLLKDSAAFLEFVKKAFGASEKMKVMNSEGTGIMHGEATVFGSCIMFGTPSEKYPEEPATMTLSVVDIDGVYKSALDAGATSLMEPNDYGFGKFGGVKDQFGNIWWLVHCKKQSKQPAVKPYFSLQDAPGFLDFLKKVFDAKEEKPRMTAPDSDRILHAESLIAGNAVMVCSANDDWGYMTGGVSVQVDNVDEIHKKGLAEGATSIVEPEDHPWGRFSGFKDSFGNTWWIASKQAGAAQNVNPYVSVKGCTGFMELVKKIFDAEETMRKLNDNEETIFHGEMKVLGADLMCSEGYESMGYITAGIAVNVPNADEIYKKAIEAGCTSKSEPTDMPWGRFCSFKDIYGNDWVINQEPKEEKSTQAHHESEGVWVNPSLKDAEKFLDWVKKVFNAEEMTRKYQEDGGRLMHAETSINGGVIQCSEGSEQFGYRSCGMFVYVPNCDETHKLALAEGATEVNPPGDQNYGRSSGVKDPFGNTFWITSAPGKTNDDILGKRNGTQHPDESSEPNVEKKIKPE